MLKVGSKVSPLDQKQWTEYWQNHQEHPIVFMEVKGDFTANSYTIKKVLDDGCVLLKEVSFKDSVSEEGSFVPGWFSCVVSPPDSESNEPVSMSEEELNEKRLDQLDDDEKTLAQQEHEKESKDSSKDKPMPKQIKPKQLDQHKQEKEKPDEKSNPNHIVGIGNIPFGRMAKCVGANDPELYIVRLSSREVLRIWPNSANGKASIESMKIKDGGASWELEVLPETTTITLAFNGEKSWTE